ncbi:MAG: aminopeptidase N [Betaproteobacteria bacterium]|nr:aminopeptidase N [Betaproteobacteria bacterium]
MRDAQPNAIYLKDYAPPEFLVETVELDVDLREDHAVVTARLVIERNPASVHPDAPLALDGDELELVSVSLDGRTLARADYSADAKRLTLASVPRRFTLDTEVRIRPRQNTKLEGLYAAKSGFVTQCEAQGFRRITYFADRPDVMAKYTTTIHADRERYPVLLSNGNLAGAGEEAGGRHWAKWVDPFRKPSYLFALVAAKLDRLADTFVTRSGRTVQLAVYVEPGYLDQSEFAMRCLKSAMKWDEDRFGLELDLDHYAIVAVGDFNSGAMENKGLNIFNAKYVLARPDVATDTDYLSIDRVVAHEYFHNWTGNRVTCRDWFQLSLKEGLTVFRDQEYGADRYSRAVQRIAEVRTLRSAQFPEDAGPMRHPVRPQSYQEIRNFYTLTVYEKGAEVVRMQHTLLGAAGFRKGMDLYFERHDGQAVTCDDFVAAMADATVTDLAQFKRWYDVAGTPHVAVAGDYDAAARRYTLTVRQSMEPPFHIPFALGLIGRSGEDLIGTRMLSIRESEERFVFERIEAEPVPSLLRNFSAPVIVDYAYSEADLTYLMAHDTDAFNRWEAGQRLAASIILERGGEPSAAYLDAVRRVLADAGRDPAFAAEALALPSESFLAEQLEVVDPDSLHAARNTLRRRLADTLRAQFAATYEGMRVTGPYSPDAVSSGRRALRNLCLGYMMETGDDAARALAVRQFDAADNMTDSMAALSALANCDCPEREPAIDRFYAKWKAEPLVVDKWLAVQAMSRLASTLADVKRLAAHPAFDIRNPNKVYSLIRAFCGNFARFNAAGGGGYAFAADKVIEIDRLNPQVAARVARAFDRWKKFGAGQLPHARAALERIRDAQGLSPDVAEIVGKALAG